MKLTLWITGLLLSSPITTLAMSNVDIVKTLNQTKKMHHPIHHVNHQPDFTWTSLNGPALGKSVTTIQMKNNPSILFAYRPYVAAQLYRSMDSGQSWQRLQFPHPVHINQLSSIDANNLIIGSNEGIYLSADLGNTWVHVAHMNQDINNLFVSEPHLIIAVVDNMSAYANVYRSTDLGHTWAPAYLGLDNLSGIWGIGGQANTLFIGTDGLNVSSNGGLLWTRPNQQWQNVFAQSIAVNSKLDSFVVGASGIYKTDAMGRIWEKIPGLQGYDSQIQVDKKDRLYLLTYDSDHDEMLLFLSSDNGKSWNKLFSSEYISNVNILENGKILLSTEKGLFQSDANQDHFTPFTTHFSVSTTEYVLALDDQHYFAVDGRYNSSAQNDTLYHSEDKGLSWKQAYHGHISALALQNNRLIMAANSDDILTSDDLGQTWQTRYHFNGNDYTTGLSVENGAIIVTRSNSQYLSFDLQHWQKLSDQGYSDGYFDGKNTYIYANSAIRVSADQGKTWATLLDNLNQFRATITGYQSKVILVAFSSAGILKSTDQGKTWDLINQGLYDFHFKTLSVIDENHYLVATDQGVFFTKDGGVHWVLENNGLEHENVLSLSIHNNLLLAGTDGAGVFKATIK